MENEHAHYKRLSNLPRNSGFKVPKGYFDTLEDACSSKLSESLFPEYSGFETPNAYFDTLENTLLSKVKSSENRRVIRLRRQILNAAGVAAIFAVVLSILLISIRRNEEPSPDDIIAWMQEHIGDIDTIDIVSFFDYNSTPDDLLFDSSLENNALEQYLDENDTYFLLEESPEILNEIY